MKLDSQQHEKRQCFSLFPHRFISKNVVHSPNMVLFLIAAVVIRVDALKTTKASWNEIGVFDNRPVIIYFHVTCDPWRNSMGAPATRQMFNISLFTFDERCQFDRLMGCAQRYSAVSESLSSITSFSFHLTVLRIDKSTLKLNWRWYHSIYLSECLYQWH